VWRDGAPNGGPPNDWRSCFKAAGPAWSFDERTSQWYLHSFLPQQPDLNWDNPEVEAAMHEVLRFWLDRGVDGFRVDAVFRLAKDPLLRNNARARRRRDQDWDSIEDRMRGIRRVVDEHPERVIIGEVSLDDLRRVVNYINSGDQLHLPWSAEAFRASIDEFEALAASTAWPAWFLANHDLPRVASRFDEDGQGPLRARAVALVLYALRGTPFVYQGEELGLPDAKIPPERVVDVDGRDPERAPIPWRSPSLAGAAAGFSTGRPWLPLVTDAESLAAERQAADPRSTLRLVRRLAALRAQTPALQLGSQRMLETGTDVLAWLREADSDRLLAAVNFAAKPVRLALPDQLRRRATLLLSTDPNRGDHVDMDLNAFELGPSEAALLRIRGLG
jgi:alpha-glucosidase